MNYIAEAPMKGGSAASTQPFTDIPTLSDEDGLVVARGEQVYVVLNLYPYNPGHLDGGARTGGCPSSRTSPTPRAPS